MTPRKTRYIRRQTELNWATTYKHNVLNYAKQRFISVDIIRQLFNPDWLVCRKRLYAYDNGNDNLVSLSTCMEISMTSGHFLPWTNYYSNGNNSPLWIKMIPHPDIDVNCFPSFSLTNQYYQTRSVSFAFEQLERMLCLSLSLF